MQVARAEPIVSVVMAVKNEAKYIATAVESIVAQMGVPLELVVVDDHSDDGTLQVLKRLEAEHRITVLSNPGRGKVSAFNAGVAAASGQYVCLFAGDDIMPEDSLAARYSTIERAGSVRPVVGLSKLRVMSADPKLDGLVIPRAPRRGSLSGTSPLMNREAAKLIFPVPAELPNEDTWMELCISYLDRLEVIHSDILCVYWRLHEGNSNNRLQRHDEFSRRRAARKRALNLFVETYSGALRADQRRELGRLIELERQRVRGSVMGVVLSGAPVMEVIRSLSCTRPSLFWIRQRFFRALSGW